MDLVDGVVRVEAIPFPEKGDVSMWLRSRVFDIKVPRSKEAEEAILSAERAVREDVPPDELRAAYAALLETLPDTDPILSRVHRYAERKGILL